MKVKCTWCFCDIPVRLDVRTVTPFVGLDQSVYMLSSINLLLCSSKKKKSSPYVRLPARDIHCQYNVSVKSNDKNFLIKSNVRQ